MGKEKKATAKMIRKKSYKRMKGTKKVMDDLRASVLVKKIEAILEYKIPNQDKVPIIIEKIKNWRDINWRDI